ncbi:hypothetical protein F5Y05DRAFT_106777 [Hypoxylon sp. FL0543]|nr:hypothetical protein F5Y05DRAFT_106777 [Hypoxylon sp. FL0543]
MKKYLTRLRGTTLVQKVKGHIETKETSFYQAIFDAQDHRSAKATSMDERAHFERWIRAGAFLEAPARDVSVLKDQQPATLSKEERALLYQLWASEVIANLEDELVPLHRDHYKAAQKHQAALREVSLSFDNLWIEDRISGSNSVFAYSN